MGRYLLLFLGIIGFYSVLFHVFMYYLEGQTYHWVTGIYWTLTTMTTLGLGDIVFFTPAGMAFTTIVLVTGIVLIFLVMPFAFIQYFFAPWIETRSVPERLTGHVIISSWHGIARGLAEQLELHGITYYLIEEDTARAGNLQSEGISVVNAPADSRETYTRLRAQQAAIVVATGADTINTNVTLTVREVAPSTPILAFADSEASIDILELSGADYVLALKQRLGEQIANRINPGFAQAHVIGNFKDLLIAEFPVHNTPFAGKEISQVGIREATGLTIVGILEQARFIPAGPDTVLRETCVPVVAGTREELDLLNELLVIYDANPKPVLIIGGGKVGRAAARVLKQRQVPVHIIEKNPAMKSEIGELPDKLFIGDAAEREVMENAGLMEAPGVLLTTNDDAMNIYLAVYCRRLAPEIRIISRVTHERNMEAIQRAGADLALSHTSLGVQAVFAALQGRDLLMIGEGVEVHELPVPDSLVGKTLAESGIAARTGLNVVALETSAGTVPGPRPDSRLEENTSLVMIGELSQLQEFKRSFY